MIRIACWLAIDPRISFGIDGFFSEVVKQFRFAIGTTLHVIDDTQSKRGPHLRAFYSLIVLSSKRRDKVIPHPVGST